MSELPVLLIRADASETIGIGHVSRMRALLAEYRKDEREAILAYSRLPKFVLNQLREEGIQLVQVSGAAGSLDDARSTAEIATSLGVRCIVLDGYHFRSDYQRFLKQAGFALVVMDDAAHLKHYYADLLVNPNLHAENLSYSCEPYTRILRGTKYVLLRRDFLAWRNKRKAYSDTVRQLLVTFGGSDPVNATSFVLRALRGVPHTFDQITVVVGPANPHRHEIERLGRRHPQLVRIEQNAANMAKLMFEADLAVTAAGSTSWEFAFLGVPMLSCAVADNQVEIMRSLAKSGAARVLGRFEQLRPDTFVEELTALIHNKKIRESMGNNGRRLVDGLGAARLVNEVRKLCTPEGSTCGW